MNRYKEIEKIVMKAKNWNTCQIWNCTDSSVNLAKIMSDLIKDYDNGFNTLPISILSALEHLAILSSTKIDLEDKWNKYYIRILLDDIDMNMPESYAEAEYLPPKDGLINYLFSYIKYEDNQEGLFAEFCENYSSPSECDSDYIYYLSRDGFSISEISELLEMNPEEVQDAIDSYGSFID